MHPYHAPRDNRNGGQWGQSTPALIFELTAL